MNDKTVAELHGLDQDDQWDRRSDEQKMQDAFRQQVRDAIKEQQLPAVMPAFADPPDDDDLTIRSDSSRIFYRLSVSGFKLAALLALEPSLLSIAVTARNTSTGCWVALTSNRVGGQVVDRLQARGLCVKLLTVRSDGQPLGPVSDERREAVYRGLVRDNN